MMDIAIRVGPGGQPMYFPPKGATHGDELRQLTARVTFYNLMQGHRLVQALMQGWADRDGWLQRIEDVAPKLDALARQRGLKHRWDLTDDPEAKEDDSQVGVAAQQALTDFHTALQDGCRRYPKEAERVLGRWNVGWHWLVLWILEGFAQGLWERLWDVTFKSTMGIDPPPESPRFAFAVRAREAPEDAVRRFDAMMTEFQSKADYYRDALARGSVPKGRLPRQATYKTIARWTEWFYQREISGKSIRRIALEHFGDESRRKDVRDGIIAVRKLLDPSEASRATSTTA